MAISRINTSSLTPSRPASHPPRLVHQPTVHASSSLSSMFERPMVMKPGSLHTPKILPTNPFRECNLALLNAAASTPIGDYTFMSSGNACGKYETNNGVTAMQGPPPLAKEEQDPLAVLNRNHRMLVDCKFYYSNIGSAQVMVIPH